MTDEIVEPAAGDDVETPPPAEPGGYAPSVAERLALYQRAGGIITPILTTVFAFFMGGIVVAATGHNPFKTYWAIFKGTGLNWFFHVGSHHIDIPFTNVHVWFPWNTAADIASAGYSVPANSLAQTLLYSTTLILTGLSVAFAFRCGLFNIGGQGQYIAGAITGVYIGTRFLGMPGPLHVVLAIVLAALAGAFWGAIAGFLKATVGAHEVITTIMLNWIVIWVGQYLFGIGGPLQNHIDKTNPKSDTVAQNTHLAVWWGNPFLQGLRKLCDEHGLLLICDEVATGFGRTGRMFACEHEDVAPDLLCVGKGLTGGYLPLSATLARSAVFDALLARPEEHRTLYHGRS